MGLDTVELVMDVEESFGIEIPDDDAQQIVTVGDLFEFVKSRAELAPAGTCLTAATFYDIRRGFQESGITERFGPSTPVVDIAPDRNRRSFWSKLSRNTKLRFPDLVRPSWIVILNVLHGPMGPNDIWVILRELIVNQLGVDADEVTPTASFVKDLGCD